MSQHRAQPKSSKQNLPVRSWGQFDRRVRFSGRKLLGRLDHFHNTILVAGCQRSGTTALSRLITGSEGMTDFQFGSDDELDAALILSGWVPYTPQGRYCFQATYLNNSYPEYFEHHDYKLIWVLRNPASVIHSMLYNWKRAALNRLFHHCGAALLEGGEQWRYEHLGVFSIPRLRRACLSYNAKVSQLFKLRERLGDDRLFIIDYEILTSNKEAVLPNLYEYIDLAYRRQYADRIHGGSINKAIKFHERHKVLLDKICMPIYKQACTMVNT
jgi:hypothetical protein